MSTFKQKKELKAQIAAATKAGKSKQTIGRLQYKLNNLTADPKGNVVKKKNGSVVKVGSGVLRTKPTGTVTRKPRKVTPRKKPLTGSPSAGLAPKKTPKYDIEVVTGTGKKKLTPHVQRLQRGSPTAERLSFVNDKPSSVDKINNSKFTMTALRKYTDAQLRTLAKKGVTKAATLLNIRLSTAPKTSREKARTKR